MLIQQMLATPYPAASFPKELNPAFVENPNISEEMKRRHQEQSIDFERTPVFEMTNDPSNWHSTYNVVVLSASLWMINSIVEDNNFTHEEIKKVFGCSMHKRLDGEEVFLLEINPHIISRLMAPLEIIKKSDVVPTMLDGKKYILRNNDSQVQLPEIGLPFLEKLETVLWERLPSS